MDGGAWWAAVHGVAKSQTQLSDFTFTFHFHALEKEMQPTPVFLPGESQGRGSLVGCRLWGRTESDTTEETWQQQQQQHMCVCVRVGVISLPFSPSGGASVRKAGETPILKPVIHLKARCKLGLNPAQE